MISFMSLPPLPPREELALSFAEDAGWGSEPVWKLCGPEKSCLRRELNPGLAARNSSLFSYPGCTIELATAIIRACKFLTLSSSTGNVQTLYPGDAEYRSWSRRRLFWYSWFFAVTPGKHRNTTSLNPRLFPSESVPIHYLSIVLPLDAIWYALDAESVATQSIYFLLQGAKVYGTHQSVPTSEIADFKSWTTAPPHPTPYHSKNRGQRKRRFVLTRVCNSK